MKKHLLALTISSLFAISVNAAVSGCPSGWVKSGDGKECVLTEKVDTPVIGTSDTTRPICINGFTYESATNKCSKTVSANTNPVNKINAYQGALVFGTVRETPSTKYYPATLSEEKCLSGWTLDGGVCKFHKIAAADKIANSMGVIVYDSTPGGPNFGWIYDHELLSYTITQRNVPIPNGNLLVTGGVVNVIWKTPPTVTYVCQNGGILKDNKCYID